LGAEINKREFWGANISQLTMGVDPSMIFWADWFIYCRPLKTGLTPLQAFLKAYQGKLPPEDEATYRRLEESVFGVFEMGVTKISWSPT
jgi:hypothetical protein